MISGDEFARELFEDAKCSLKDATEATDLLLQQRHLRHATMSAFSFLELQIELLAQHFKDSHIFSLHERAMITQRDIGFDKGNFKLKSTSRYTRLQDRMLLLQSKFKGAKLTSKPWWPGLQNGTERRNNVAHPKGPVHLELDEVRDDLTNVLACASDLFEIIFVKRLPYESMGLTRKIAK